MIHIIWAHESRSNSSGDGFCDEGQGGPVRLGSPIFLWGIYRWMGKPMGNTPEIWMISMISMGKWYSKIHHFLGKYGKWIQRWGIYHDLSWSIHNFYEQNIWEPWGLKAWEQGGFLLERPKVLKATPPFVSDGLTWFNPQNLVSHCGSGLWWFMVLGFPHDW